MSREYVIVVTQDADSQPIEHRVSGLPVSMGRDASNDVQVASQFVSGFHAKVEEIKGRVFVRDLGSRNGTQVNMGDGAKTRLAAHSVFDLSQCHNEFFLGSSVRVQVVDPTQQAAPWRPSKGSAPRRVPDFMDMPGRGGPTAPPLPDMPPPGGAWDRAADPGPVDFGNGPLSLPPLPGEGRGGRPPEARGSGEPPFGGAREPLPPPPVRGFEPVGREYGSPPGGAGSPQLATGNFQLSIEGLAFQGLRELAGSLLPGQVLETQGDVARFITRLHDVVDVLCRTLIPLRRNYLEFVSSMSLRKGGQVPGMALIDMARDPSGVAAALLDFREGAPEASKALEHALGELSSHQVALLDGVMQGVRALLDELSPAAINDATEHKRGGLRIGGREKDAWDEYCERYEHLADERDAFARVFGEEFAEAYRRRLR
jgi:type VI secretion system protein ImpI